MPERWETGPYFTVGDYTFTATRLREIVNAEGSPFVLTTKAELEKINEALGERVALFDEANRKIAELEAKLSRRKKPVGD